MTNSGPWTPDGRPETRKSRTWWIVGGIILAVLVVFVAYLMGRGWDAATQDSAQETTTATSAPGPAPTQQMNVGGKDPVALADTLENVVGVSITPMEADKLATSSCDAMDAGETPRAVADEFAANGGARWDDQQGRLMAMTMMLEYCPRHAE